MRLNATAFKTGTSEPNTGSPELAGALEGSGCCDRAATACATAASSVSGSNGFDRWLSMPAFRHSATCSVKA